MGSDNAEQSTTNVNTTYYIINYNSSDSSGNPGFVAKLLEALNELAGSLNLAKIAVTNNDTTDLASIKTQLYNTTTAAWSSQFLYVWNGNNTQPSDMVSGKPFFSFQDFTNCPQSNQQAISGYISGADFVSKVPFMTSSLSNDLQKEITPLLETDLMSSWQTKAFSKAYTDPSNSAHVVQCSALITYTMVSSKDGNGNQQNVLFLYYLGGLYDAESL